MKEYTVRVYDNRTEWISHGQLHREDGPARIWADGTKGWWYNGKIHREDGPAIECADGTKFWYQNDKLHREDGPAVEWADGTREWCLNGEEMTEEEHAEKMKKPETDPIVEAVREKFLSRSEAGQRKYNSMLDRDDLSREQWLVHLQEELMDAVNYIEVLLQRKDCDPQP